MTQGSSIFLSQNILSHYNKFVASAANQDKGLKLLQWTLWLFSKVYTKKGKALMKTSADISFARYILRIYGLPTAIEAIQNKTWEDASSGFPGRVTGKLMALSMIFYYPLEHLAYIRWTSPEVLPGRTTANKLSAYSCRCWLLYLLAEITQSMVRLKRLYASQRKLLNNGYCDEEPNQDDSDEKTRLALQRSIQNEWLQISRSALFTLPCFHWSLPKWDTEPWLSESVCNGLMWAESMVSMYQALSSYRSSLE